MTIELADRAKATCTARVYDPITDALIGDCGAPATCSTIYEHLWDTPDGVLHGEDVEEPLCGFHGNELHALQVAGWADSPTLLPGEDPEAWSTVYTWIGVSTAPVQTLQDFFAATETIWNDEPPF